MKDNEGRIVILKRTERNMCGGTDAYLDTAAPKEIDCETIETFSAESDFSSLVFDDASDRENIGYLSVFAAHAEKGTFLFMKKEGSTGSRGESRCVLVSSDIFPELAKLTAECGLAKNNGYHSYTHGLPKNFGGTIDVRYTDGSVISISDNQSPVLSHEAAKKIAKLFTRYMNEPQVKLPAISDLSEIRFEQKRRKGGFTKAKLTINEDGTGINEKQQCFDDPKIYESTKEISAETIGVIKRNIENNLMLAWTGLPERRSALTEDKTMTFVFKDGSEITVGGCYALPYSISGAFFNIELELVTKN